MGSFTSLFKHSKRYKELTLFLIKYGHSDILKKMKGLDLEVPSEGDSSPPDNQESLAKDLQELGPTFVKFGQLLSSQYDLLPKSYQKALNELQDKGESFPLSQVKEIIYGEFHHDIEDIFAEFEEESFAAGSLAQVHRAVLPSGKEVVVKIQRPGIQEQIKEDLEILGEMAEFLDKHRFLGKSYYWKDKVDVFHDILLNELNFQTEALNLERLKKNLEEIDDLIIPSPIMDYTTPLVLTMEYIPSKKITTMDSVARLDLDGEKLARVLFDAYLKQLFVDGFVHSDPHPGNVYLTENNQIALLDVGMVMYLSQFMQQGLLQIILAVAEGRGEEAADYIIKLGNPEENFQACEFKEQVTELVVKNQKVEWSKLVIGGLFIEISTIASDTGLRLSSKFNVYGKILMNLDGIVKILDPHFDSNEYVKKNINSLFQRRLNQFFSKESFYRIGMDMQEVVLKIPFKVNEFLNNLSKREIQVKLQPKDEFKIIHVFEKIANRIALGLVLASLIVGAALLMSIPTEFQLFGYPGLAILFFLAAAFGGFLFILNILMYDEKPPESK
jgi:ubiquinone biosynthesis protein